MATINIAPVPSDPYKHWNFRKVNWELYSLITNKLSQELPPPGSSCFDEAYQDFCNTILVAAKISITRGRRNNYRSCREKKCEYLYQVFFRHDKVRLLALLHPRCFLDLMKNERLLMWGCQFHRLHTHSSVLAWNTINNLTGRRRHLHRSCPISANLISVQWVQNGVYKTKDREPDLWCRRHLNLARFLTRQMYLWRFFSGKICQCPLAANIWENSGVWFYMSRANTLCRCYSEVLVKQIFVFQNASTQAT